jgi:predicted Rossmann fold nucleotide-binding protein DprA/Smf involved in DNA uptake
MKSEILSDLYPDSLTAIFGTKAPQTLFFAGNSSLLNKKKIGLFVSVNCPGTMIFQSYDFVSKMRSRDNISFLSGFHSPMEKECLRSLSIGNAGIIWCLAKSIEAFKLPEELELVFSDGKLLLLSSFPEKISRITKQTALERNKLVAAIADEIFFSYAEPGGKTEKLCQADQFIR